MKQKWQELLAWTASKGISAKGTVVAILAFILGAVIF